MRFWLAWAARKAIKSLKGTIDVLSSVVVEQLKASIIECQPRHRAYSLRRTDIWVLIVGAGQNVSLKGGT